MSPIRKATLLFGYDVETCSENTLGFLDGARSLHRQYGVPWTIYLTGQTVENYSVEIRGIAADPLLTIGQHTYSHMLLKSVYMTPGDGKPLHGRNGNFFAGGGSIDEIRQEIATTQELIRDRLGVECRGLTGPWGYYRGLVDRPDILQILQDNGILWIRTNARDHRDCQPVPFSEQPFFYADQGFAEILELGVQGYQDEFYWERFDDRSHGDTYLDYLDWAIRETARTQCVWNVCAHDHATATGDAFRSTKGKWLEHLIVRAEELGVRIMSPGDFYREMMESAKVAAEGT